ncbi:MAG: tetratricopeptide repeat protein [Fimbriimonadaceae bacterium]
MKHAYSVGAVVVVVGSSGCANESISANAALTPVAEVYRAPFDISMLDRELRFYQGRVKRDPAGAIGWAMLSSAYLKRSRVYDANDNAIAAEEAARRSLKLRRLNNVSAATLLVQALLDQHRFKDAAAAAKDALAIDPRDAKAIMLVIDTLFEIGQYDASKKVFLREQPRLAEINREELAARFDELSGNRAQALQRISRLITAAKANPGIDAAAMSTFYTRRGDLLASTGKMGEAEADYASALKLHPASWKALGGMVRLAVAQKSWNAAVEWGRKSEKFVQMPELLGLMGDAYKALGASTTAKRYYRKAVNAAGYGMPATANHGGRPHTAKEAKQHGSPLGRQFAMFAADRGIYLDDAYKAAKADLEERQDYRAFDTLAWLQFKRNEQALARKSIDKALLRGMNDPQVLAHAAEIYRSSNRGKARRLQAAAAKITSHARFGP